MSAKSASSILDRSVGRDPKTELFLWQRTLFFRPWYRGTKVAELGFSDGRYLRYMANFADEAIGLDSDTEKVQAANQLASKADFRYSDFVNETFEADVTLGFEFLEEQTDPEKTLGALVTSFKGNQSLVLSATNKACKSKSELVPDHRGKWTATEFRTLIEKAFKGQTITFLHQTPEWPAQVKTGANDNALYTIAVVGDRALPVWPRLGLAMPTISAERVRNAVLGFSRFYPGDIRFAVVANGACEGNLVGLRGLATDLPNLIHLIESPENLGFARGCNAGLDWLWQEEWFDLFGVTNDDVSPAIDCLPQMVSAFDDLREAGQKPGVIGPVTNEIHGPQQVEIGSYTNFDEMIELSSQWHSAHHSSGTPTDRIRGLLMLIDPDCLSEVGGFDPIFGLGNWEDDDHNLRCRLAGYTLWIADGAFLHHQGSATFKEIGLKYDATIQRNLELICEKWGVERVEDLFTLQSSDIPLYVHLAATSPASGHRVRIDGAVVDLVHQATDVEFCAFIFEAIRNRDRSERLAILDAIQAA